LTFCLQADAVLSMFQRGASSEGLYQGDSPYGDRVDVTQVPESRIPKTENRKPKTGSWNPKPREVKAWNFTYNSGFNCVPGPNEI